ncbi:EAL domain-containing protein [Lentzea sp. HUAS12]|uniref:EAL domain-containing protein n=1 Tax=Lentzea sp. HUAS12 TaxID=2951806 RepID=UPI0020A11817|nr:EAL domain-containing protein [Lentzea sp. HUAS12]USX56391.1 EAL domain-containing protein [Lentzea sp. HUAS12]
MGRGRPWGPLKGTDSARHELARYLRGIAVQQKLTVKEIGVRCGCSDTTVSKQINGAELPDWQFVVRFVEACTSQQQWTDRKHTARGLWDAARRSNARPRSGSELPDAYTRLLQAKDETIQAYRQLAAVNDDLNDARKQLLVSIQVENQAAQVITVLRIVLMRLSTLITNLTADRDRSRREAAVHRAELQSVQQRLTIAEQERARADAQLAQAEQERDRAARLSDEAQTKIVHLESRLRSVPLPDHDLTVDLRGVDTPSPDDVLRDTTAGLDRVQQLLDGQDRDLTALEFADMASAFSRDHDQLTGLKNRSALVRRLEWLLRNAPERSTTLYHFSVDSLPTIARGLGQSARDRILQHVATRLRHVFFQEHSLVCRLDGEEFVVLVEDETTSSIIVSTISNVAEELSDPFWLDGGGIAVSMSTGVLPRLPENTSPECLLRASGATLHRARSSGSGEWAMYDPAVDDVDRGEAVLAAFMAGAWEEGQITVFHRPVHMFAGDTKTLVESRLRWNHPLQGEIHHDRCVTIAKRSGLMRRIGRWALSVSVEKVTQDNRTLLVTLTDDMACDPDLVSYVLQLLDRSTMPAGRLLLDFPVQSLLAADDSFDNAQILSDRGVLLGLHEFTASPAEIQLTEELPVRMVRIGTRSTTPYGRTAEALTSALSYVRRAGRLIIADHVSTFKEADMWGKIGVDGFVGVGLIETEP